MVKKFIPQNLLSQYHKLLAILSKWVYGNPSAKMIVIGVTGTNGKSSTVMMISKILEASGHKVGYTTTAMFKIGEKEWLNDKKMTMLGRLALQKLLRQMVSAGCQYAVIETSSEGIKQYRHLGINYDVAVFTNLTPEHIESHGSFDNYKAAKLKLFSKVASGSHKVIDGKKIMKAIIANSDDKYSEEFLNFKAEQKIKFGIDSVAELRAQNLEFKPTGVSFDIAGIKFDLQLFGRFNIFNALAAIAVAKSQSIDLVICRQALEKIKTIPGRMEFVGESQPFNVLVDYAPEPESLKQLYQTIFDHNLKQNKLIHVLGSCGGGRDVARRSVLGQLAGEQADYVIVTNEDPYDDDPMMIIDQVAEGAVQVGKEPDKDLFKILDRRQAIAKALSLAGEGDLVLLTGKGSEQAICVAGGKKIPWDEREVARELLKNIKN